MPRTSEAKRHRAEVAYSPGISQAERAAMAAYERADFVACKSFLELIEPGDSGERARLAFLRARIARVEGDTITWKEMASSAASLFETAPERAAALALLLLAVKRENLEEAVRLRTQATSELFEIDAHEAGYAAYLLSVDAFEDRDYARCEELIARNLEAGVELGDSFAMLGWVAVKQERFRDAAKHFSDALSAFADNGGEFRAKARALVGATAVASDGPDLKLGRKARALYDEMTWTPALRIERLNIMRGLRRLALLEGDIEGAFTLARESTTVAPTPAYAALAEITAASTARLLGDEHAVALQLRRAWGLLRGTTWAATDNEERTALLMFALEAAPTMPQEARKAITLYDSVRAKSGSPSMDDEEDRRLRAFALWAEGRVDAATGKRDEAVARFRESLDLWAALEYEVHAALVALDLSRIVGGDVHRGYLRSLAKRAPKAWIVTQSSDSEAALKGLSRAQRLVLLRLLEGLSAKAIGEELGRSPFTVINHTRKIFSAYDVHSRDELIRACRELGVTPQSVRATL